MILPDVNVLLYAFRPDSAHHKNCSDWLSAIVNGPSAFGISPQVLSSVIRLATHPKIFARPSPAAEAIRFADVLLEQPHCTVIHPGPRHWTIFRDLCKATNASGNLIPDAWFAALAIEQGCEWITTDRDFARFPGLRYRTLA